jgi:hypothetical protein
MAPAARPPKTAKMEAGQETLAHSEGHPETAPVVVVSVALMALPVTCQALDYTQRPAVVRAAEAAALGFCKPTHRQE